MRFLKKRYLLLALCALGVLAVTKNFATSGGTSGSGGEPPGFACEDLTGQLKYVGPPFAVSATVTDSGSGTAEASGGGAQVGEPSCQLTFAASGILLGGDFANIKPAQINGLCSTETTSPPNGLVDSSQCALEIQACASAGGFQILGSTHPQYNATKNAFTTDLVVMCVTQR